MIKSSLSFSLGTLCSRISGLLREAILSYTFGAAPLFDAFIIALRIPNLLRDMLAEGALSQAFTKVYSELQLSSPEKGKQLLTNCTVLFSLFSLLIVVLGVVFAEELVSLFTLLTGGEKTNLIADATVLTRIVFPYLLFAVVSSIFMGALHQEGRFFRSAVAPIMLNIGFIIGALGLARLFPHLAFLPVPPHLRAISGLAVGIVIGGALHCWLLWSMLATKLQWRWTDVPCSQELKKVLILMLPMTLAYSSAPITSFINTNFATSLQSGAVSWLYYAFRLVHLPIGLFAVAIGVVILPALTRTLQGTANSDASKIFWQAQEFVLWLMAVCLVYVAGNSLYITQFIYQHGSFTFTDSVQTSNALLMYSLGLFGYGLLKVLTAVYYAVNRTAFVMRVALTLIAVNILANILLVEQFGAQGLALTSSIVVSLNALVLLWGLQKEKIHAPRNKILRCLGYLLAFCLLSYLAQTLLINPLLTQITIENLKLKSATILASNALLVLSLFLISLMLYFKKSFKNIIKYVRIS